MSEAPAAGWWDVARMLVWLLWFVAPFISGWAELVGGPR